MLLWFLLLEPGSFCLEFLCNRWQIISNTECSCIRECRFCVACESENNGSVYSQNRVWWDWSQCGEYTVQKCLCSVQEVFSISKLVLKLTGEKSDMDGSCRGKHIAFWELKKKVCILHFYQFNNAGIVPGRVCLPHGTAGISCNSFST